MSISDPQRVFPTAISIAILSIIVLLFMSMRKAPHASAECECPLLRLDDAFCHADLVFEGIPVAMDTAYVRGDMRNSSDNTIAHVAVRFQVQRVIKGNFPTMLVNVASVDRNACGFSFILGQRYLVFATHENGMVITDRCTPTRNMDTVTRGFADSLAYVMSGKQWEGRVPVDTPCR
jgi:hypothetical protein